MSTQNPNIQAIVDRVFDNLSQYNTPESITPSVVAGAIGLAVQNLYSPQDLFMGNNGVTSLDLTNYVNLERLYAKDNPFVSLDFSNAVALKVLHLSSCELNTGLDLSNQPNLEEIDLSSFSDFTNGYSLDLSSNTALKNVVLDTILINSLNLTNCTVIDKLELYSINGLTDLDLTSQTVLKTLNLANIPTLNNLDISNCTDLEKLNITGVTLNTFNITPFNQLVDLSLISTNLTNFDPSPCASLKTLDLSSNSIPNLDFSQNTNLETIILNANPLDGTNLNSNTVKTISLFATGLTSLDLSGLPSLEALDARNLNLSGNLIDISNCPNLKSLNFTATVIDSAQHTANLEILDTNGLTNGIYTYKGFSFPSSAFKTSLEAKGWVIQSGGF
ncbi:leucine-rich repeat domain-containing protein [Aurantibacter aestuarii]|uniref:Internalin n=1 Tax=Aurantibacter aestuarii TaxID=1266046 RepID=A0A2T1NEJ4_9FLAO|nr:hypothetical protein [Aurantibacter aestuarii]PSG90873.1 hypothetical protein C7H52_06260 [Aurantibacter aestuarii]